VLIHMLRVDLHLNEVHIKRVIVLSLIYICVVLFEKNLLCTYRRTGADEAAVFNEQDFYITRKRVTYIYYLFRFKNWSEVLLHICYTDSRLVN